MPDFINHRSGTATAEGMPEGWGAAFAALPMETPPGDGWARLADRLDARHGRGGSVRRERRMTWLIGVASAAVLVLAAWSPLSRWLQADVAQADPPAVVAQAVPGMRGPAAPVRTLTDEPRHEAIDATQERVVAVADAATPPAQRKPTRHARALASRQPAQPAAVVSPASASASASEPTVTGDGAHSAAAVALAEPDPLQKLQAQSAQLEALVALARDERVGNASSELLSSQLDAGIAAIDASLSLEEVTAARKQELWQQRVDLLRQLAGVEATSRWLAAQGSSSNTNLVAVD